MSKKKIDIHDYIHQLLDGLRKEGFSIGNDVYITTTKLFAWFLETRKGETIDEFVNYLSPLICKSEEEQIKFKKIFETKFGSPLNEKLVSKKTKKDYNSVWWALLLLIPVIILFILLRKVDVNKEALIFNDVKKGDEIPIDLTSVFSRKIDHSRIEFQSKFHRSQKTWSEHLVKHTFEHYGRDTFSVTIKSDKYNLDTTLSYPNILVGPTHVISISPEKEPVYVGEQNTFTAEIDTAFSKEFYWEINGQDLDSNRATKTLTYTFESPGEHIIAVRYDTTTDKSISIFPARQLYGEYVQKVLTRDLQLTATHSELPPTIGMSPNPFWLIALFILLLLLLFALYKIQKKRQDDSKQGEAEKNFKGSQPPFDIPFTSRDKNIAGSYPLVRLSNELKKRTESESTYLNIPKTIFHSIQNFGFLTPGYSRKLIQREYLFLIDKAHFNSQQARLFQYLAKFFISQSVRLDYYFFNNVPDRFYKTPDGPRIPLSTIQDQHYQSAVIIVTEGSFFVNNLTASNKKPSNEKQIIANKFTYWDKRVLLTPVPYNDWGRDENMLSKFFQVLPGDVSGLLELIRAIEDGELPLSKNPDSPLSTYQAKYVDFHTSHTIREYLNDEELFQWLCAMAVHPKFYWEVFLEMGKEILTNKSKLNYTNVLKLARIKWIHEGEIPPGIRLMLLKELTVENELIARETLLRMIDEIPIGEEIFSFEERELGSYTNSFVLAASGNTKYTGNKKILEGEKRFISLYKNRMFGDNPFILYAEKEAVPTGVWTTPINVNRKNRSITDYINDREQNQLSDQKKNKLFRKLRIAATVTGIFATLMLMYGLLFSKEALANHPLNDSLNLVDIKSTSNDSCVIFITPEGCINSLLNDSKNPVVDLDLNIAGRFQTDASQRVGDRTSYFSTTSFKAGDSLYCELSIGDTSFTVVVPVEAGLYTLEIAGDCPSTDYFVNYFPGYEEDTSLVTQIREVEYLVYTFTEDMKSARRANMIRFDARLDTAYMHNFASLMIQIKFPLKHILISGSEYEPFSKPNQRVVEISGDNSYDRWPTYTQDSIDCFFRKKNCGGTNAVVVPKGTIQVFADRSFSGSVLKGLRSCLKEQTMLEVPLEREAPNIGDIKGDFIFYSRRSFVDSTSLLINCLKNYFPNKSFTTRLMPPEWNSGLSAEIYLYEKPLQWEIFIDVSDEELFEEMTSFRGQLEKGGYLVDNIRVVNNIMENVVEYYLPELEDEAVAIRNAYNQFNPELPVKLKYMSSFGSDLNAVYLKVKRPTRPRPKHFVQNINLSKQLSNSPDPFSDYNKILIDFNIISVNHTSSSRTITGELCSVQQKQKCKTFTFSDNRSDIPIHDEIEVPANEYGRYSVQLQIKEFDIDTTLGSIVFDESTPEPTRCDTLYCYITRKGVDVDLESSGQFNGNRRLKEKGIDIQFSQTNEKFVEITYIKDGCRAQKARVYLNKPQVLELCDKTRFTFEIVDSRNNGMLIKRFGNEKFFDKVVIFNAIFCDRGPTAD